MRAFAVAVLAGILAFPSATVVAGNKGGAGKPSRASSSGHMSIEGARNTNGQWSSDRDKGLDRAQERRSDSALDHSNAVEPYPGHDSRKRQGQVKLLTRSSPGTYGESNTQFAEAPPFGCMASVRGQTGRRRLYARGGPVPHHFGQRLEPLRPVRPAQGSFGMRAETTSNSYLARSEQLDPRQIAALTEAGWAAPTGGETIDSAGRRGRLAELFR